MAIGGGTRAGLGAARATATGRDLGLSTESDGKTPHITLRSTALRTGRCTCRSQQDGHGMGWGRNEHPYTAVAMLGPTGGHTGWLSLHPRGPPHRPAPQAPYSQGHLLLKAPSGQCTLSPADALPTSALPPTASGAVRAAPVSCKPWATPRPPKGNCAQVQSRCSCRVSLQAEQTQGDVVSAWLTPQALRPAGLQAPPAPPGSQAGEMEAHRPAAHTAACTEQDRAPRAILCGPRVSAEPQSPRATPST